jgi:ribokinase
MNTKGGDAMKKPEVTVVGSFAVGLTMRAPKLPIFGETMLGKDFDMGPGGKGSNQAVATARLGARSSIVASIGTDKLASIATDLYAAEGVDTAHLSVNRERATGVGFIILNDRGENFIILDMGANELMDERQVDAAETRIAESGVVMTVLEIPTAAAERAMALGRRHGARTILNPAPARALPDSIFAHVDYLTPNESELRILLGLPPDDPRSSRELAGELRKRGVRNVVVTLGRTGALILTDELDIMVPAIPVSVVDTTGAGDAFNSGFAVALAEGRGIVEAVRFGVTCGAIACTALGVVPSLPTRAQADALFAEAKRTIWKDHHESQPAA